MAAAVTISAVADAVAASDAAHRIAAATSRATAAAAAFLPRACAARVWSRAACSARFASRLTRSADSGLSRPCPPLPWPFASPPLKISVLAPPSICTERNVLAFDFSRQNTRLLDALPRLHTVSHYRLRLSQPSLSLTASSLTFARLSLSLSLSLASGVSHMALYTPFLTFFPLASPPVCKRIAIKAA